MNNILWYINTCTSRSGVNEPWWISHIQWLSTSYVNQVLVSRLCDAYMHTVLVFFLTLQVEQVDLEQSESEEPLVVPVRSCIAILFLLHVLGGCTNCYNYSSRCVCMKSTSNLGSNACCTNANSISIGPIIIFLQSANLLVWNEITHAKVTTMQLSGCLCIEPGLWSTATQLHQAHRWIECMMLLKF